MKRTYFIYLVICFLVWSLGIFFARGDFSFFFNAPSLMIVLVPSIAMLFGHFYPSEIRRSFSLAMKDNTGTDVEIKNAMLVFGSLQKYIICSAFIGFILGIVLMFGHVEDPSVFGRGLAVSLLAIIYASVVVMIITVPFSQALKKKLNELQE